MSYWLKWLSPPSPSLPKGLEAPAPFQFQLRLSTTRSLFSIFCELGPGYYFSSGEFILKLLQTIYSIWQQAKSLSGSARSMQLWSAKWCWLCMVFPGSLACTSFKKVKLKDLLCFISAWICSHPCSAKILLFCVFFIKVLLCCPLKIDYVPPEPGWQEWKPCRENIFFHCLFSTQELILLLSSTVFCNEEIPCWLGKISLTVSKYSWRNWHHFSIEPVSDVQFNMNWVSLICVFLIIRGFLENGDAHFLAFFKYDLL